MIKPNFIRKSSIIGSLVTALFCSSATAEPVPVLTIADLFDETPDNPLVTGNLNAQLSDDGRFLLLFSSVQYWEDFNTLSKNVHFFMDLKTNNKIDLSEEYPGLGIPKSMSANGRYIISSDAILDLKTGVLTTDFSAIPNMAPASPLSNYSNLPANIMSDDGRYIAYRFQPAGCNSSNGYVLDQLNLTTELATPNLGTTDEIVCASNQTVTDAHISGDGSRFFWGTDGTESDIGNRWGLGSINTRDIFAHDLKVGSTDNTRVSNCDGCDDTSTTSGSSAYDGDVSADGKYATFRSFHDYGYGKNNTGYSIYVRNLETLETELITPAIAGGSAFNAAYHNPSISSDGRFVVYNGNGGFYIRDREATEQQLLFEGSAKGMISGDGNTIVLKQIDGWYILDNPLVAGESDYASDVLFVTMPNSDNSWSQFANTSLVADNTWVGYLTFDDTYNEFKFDVGGTWNVAGELTTSANWNQNYGDNQQDGQAELNGQNIVVTQGTGVYKITFNDNTLAYSVEKQQAEATGTAFTCMNGTTSLGQSVYAVGNIESLGNWNVANAVKLDPTAYPTWTADIAIPANTQVEWKCIKRNENDPTLDLVWQSGNNNSFDSSNTTSTQGSF